MKLLLALIGFLRGLQPLAHLLREPERVIRLIQNVEHKAGTAAALAARQIILRPRAHFERLRRHAFARGAERRARLDTLLLRLARGGGLGTVRLFSLRAVGDALPLQAHLLHAEIIRRAQFKDHDLGLQHHLLLSLAARGQFRSLVLCRLHADHQRHPRRQAQRVLPCKRHFPLPLNRLRGTYNTSALHLRRRAVNFSLRQGAARRGLEGRQRAFQQAHHVAADFGDRLRLVLQVIRQLQLHIECGEFRARARLQFNRLPHVADLHENLRV